MNTTLYKQVYVASDFSVVKAAVGAVVPVSTTAPPLPAPTLPSPGRA